MPTESWMRAADVDREETVEILRRSYADGRMSLMLLVVALGCLVIGRRRGTRRSSRWPWARGSGRPCCAGGAGGG